jgi:hypothetical protein
MHKFIIALLGVFIFNACELVDEIDYEISVSDNYIVMCGYISYETGVSVLVTKTVPVNSHDDSDLIDNPVVWLYENGQPLKQLSRLDEYNFFLSSDSVFFNESASYSIVVEADGFETAVSYMQQFVSKTMIDTVYIDSDSNFVYCEFIDDVEVENYYSYKIKYYNDGETDSTDITKVIPNYTFSDEGFDSCIVKCNDLSRYEFDSIQIKLYSVSKDYANFIGSYFDYKLSYGDFNYEDVYPVESQVENGFGYFVSYEVSECILKNSSID